MLFLDVVYFFFFLGRLFCFLSWVFVFWLLIVVFLVFGVWVFGVFLVLDWF